MKSFKLQSREQARQAMEENRKQVKCPSCGSYKTIPNSKKTTTMATGFALIFLGAIFSIFVIGIIIGIPLILIGFVVLFSSYAIKETGEIRCRACGLMFIDKKEVV